MKKLQQFRLSIEMIKLLEKEMKIKSKNKTEIIEQALRDYFFKK